MYCNSFRLDTVRGNPDSGFQKRVCNGFPCMYSHLGTKAGRASLYRTLASFIDDCLNDASCDPGKCLYNLSHVTRKPVVGIFDQVRLKQASSATEAS